ncbi:MULTISPECIES: alternative ribosome rescue aminoacyl-tRNA hydrolase ArfB [Myroides]|uniref:Aminoacyl-tRNA hydrolase n=1 Tax=Myroides albus TaxID=2562892 RepID=A0A6I3LP75_9FLAO|nr:MULTISPECIES: alternative ribosome rescue aminoacyl-tRNA hydrolase ArfB [Myroides]MTG98461.1 aminoacyl-tRNA hydrolase [Myroides albus]MVX34434.1 aminoacyl-tRNA hydrolase [Myroides sp. LoEW2-1]UVD78218.1 aminoacyl-tRNA hydrolase [Myroides albus]
MIREIIEKECDFKAVRSGGAGGQHVNKVSSKVVLFWNAKLSQGITNEERELLFERLKNRFNKEGILIIEADTTRSQIKNREIVIQKLFDLLSKGLATQKERKATKTPKRIVQKRKETKEKISLKKALRKRIF